MGGGYYILYATAGKSVEINGNHFGGHISMVPVGSPLHMGVPNSVIG